jgi:hypothetical protein
MLVDRFESDDFWEHLGGKPKDSEIQVCWSWPFVVLLPGFQKGRDIKAS